MRIRFLRLEKISWKLTIIYSLLFSCVLLLLSAGVLSGVWYYLLDQDYATIKSSSEETISRILDTNDSEASLTDIELLSEAQTDSDINITIADPNGKIISQSRNYQLTQSDVQFRPGVIRRVTINGIRMMILNSVVSDGIKTIANLQITLKLEKSYKFIGILFMLLAAADTLGIISSVLVGYIISKKMLKPIDKITKTAQSISINDLGTRIPTGKADDEITRLAETFNDMLDRLKDSIDRQSAFVSDASHELRTPISVIMGYSNLLDRWGKDDKTVLQESVGAIKSEAMGMRELVEKLLFLARNDSCAVAVNKEEFELNELLQDIVDESRLIAPSKDIAVVVNYSLVLKADKKMIKQMLRNLVDNSIKFAKPGGKITIQAEHVAAQVKITVQDDGIGIPLDELEHIFDRFYRVDKARSKETGGSGLGLSIVKSIVDAHGGIIHIDSSPDVGTCVTVILPQA